jgi:hypothetical protein
MAVPAWMLDVARGPNLSGIPVKLGAITGAVTAGVFDANPQGAWSPDPCGYPDIDFQTYCTDILPHFSSPNDYIPTPYASATGMNPPWVLGGIKKAAYLYENRTALMGATSDSPAVENAGLQLAIWETLYDTSLDIAAGSFFVRGTATGDALQAMKDAKKYLDAIPTTFTAQPGTWLKPNVGTGEAPYQGLIFTPRRVPDGGLTITLLGMALTGASLFGRRLRG